MDRRAALNRSRRVIPFKARRKGIIDQTSDSSMEGPNSSRTAQKPAKALRARRA